MLVKKQDHEFLSALKKVYDAVCQSPLSFDSFMLNGEVDSQYFLQDGLHLNNEGYKVVRNNLQAHI